MTKNNSYLAAVIALFVVTALELFLYPHLELGNLRTYGLLATMTSKALLVALVYMNLKQEGWALQVAFYALIPVGLYFLLFMMYDAAYLWKS